MIRNERQLGYFGAGTANFDPTDAPSAPSGGGGSSSSNYSFSSSSGGTNMTSSDILDKYEKSYAEARSANELRYQQGMDILGKAVQRYQPGGDFGKGAMAQYEQGKTQAMAGGMQSLVNAGLSNTTVAAGLPLAYEQEVGTPFRLQLEDMRMGNLTEAEQAKTAFIEKRQDPYPDFGMFAQLAMQAATSGNQSGDIYTGLGTNARQGLDIFGTPLSGSSGGLSGFGSSSSSGGGGSIPYGSLEDLMSSMAGGGGSGAGGLPQGALAVNPGTSTGGGANNQTTTPMDPEEYRKLLDQNRTANAGLMPVGPGMERVTLANGKTAVVPAGWKPPGGGGGGGGW
jgi:hypothetical protein